MPSKFDYLCKFYSSPNKTIFLTRQMLLYVLEHDRVTLLAYLLSIHIPKNSPLYAFQNSLLYHTDYSIDQVVNLKEIDSFFKEYIKNRFVYWRF